MDTSDDCRDRLANKNDDSSYGTDSTFLTMYKDLVSTLDSLQLLHYFLDRCIVDVVHTKASIFRVAKIIKY